MDDAELLRRLDAIRGWLTPSPEATMVPVAVVRTALDELDSLIHDVRTIGT